MSSRHETFPFAVVVMLFYSYLDFVDFYAQLVGLSVFLVHYSW